MLSLGQSELRSLIDEMAGLCLPQAIHVCEGSTIERVHLEDLLVKNGTFTRLNEQCRPHSFLALSDPDDVARVENRTFICTEREEDAGPTNHWKSPSEMKAHLKKLFRGCMSGRTMYVIPYCMGPYESKMARLGVEITDSPYVVLGMGDMTRMGRKALDKILGGTPYIVGVHSVGVPLREGQKDVPWPCNPEKWIAHFPETREIWSYGSGYGGNALLGKKCFALRLASYMARKEGWMAEHMLILGVTNPEGKKCYIAAAFPSACGKTNMAMLTPNLPGWKVECVGDDIAWLHVGEDGALYAINPEAGFFGVAPGTSTHSNPNAMKTIAKNTVFTNVGLTEEGDVWWEGMTEYPPEGKLVDWKGKLWSKKSSSPCAHPNARFTVSIQQCPILDPQYDNPAGVKIDAIVFGGRMSQDAPLIVEAETWTHGVFLGASLASERTAAAVGKIGDVRRDPFAMLPFCGYHMGDYFQHWLDMGKKISPDALPHIFHVNWFRKANGKFLWPGFSDNSRIIKWMCERIEGSVSALHTPLGFMPHGEDLSLEGLNITEADLEELFRIDPQAQEKNLADVDRSFRKLKGKTPAALYEEITRIKQSLRKEYPS